ncbi:MAG: bifunctional methylenetetrahydrofolate dehydrogenase/methenyltetrahydrofolate cyclohydrolase FolD [Candidatus Aureabacteria bacterium]|nr:bifunctional methylenetetrahydrofolate dehydrogenase/methenyltetrahydrofolate cyclohydrolase FolD [Candidatus Auribacterota bacterium]
MAKILDGKKIAAEITQEIKKAVGKLRLEKGVVPGIAFITAGDDPASRAYVTMKERACEEAGIRSWQFSFPALTKEEKLLAKIKELNASPEVHGILVQLPLPAGLDTHTILAAASPEKDVDGFHPVNMGKLLLGQEGFCPCTPMGIVELLIRSGMSWRGKDVVIVGRSTIVGKPLAALLMQRRREANATVTLCHTGTRDLAAHTRRAEILVAAIGKARFIKADMVGEGAAVIDVGINRVEDKTVERGYRLVGDVDFDEVAPNVAAISPVPGGVGPMTIAMLLRNTLKAAAQSCQANGR